MKQLMLGNEAIARGAYEAGVRVSSAYPGTPSTEINENIANYREPHYQADPTAIFVGPATEPIDFFFGNMQPSFYFFQVAQITDGVGSYATEPITSSSN